MLLRLIGSISSSFLFESTSKINGQCSWVSLGRVHYILSVPLLNPNWKSMDNVLTASWANALTFRYSIFNRGQWVNSFQLPHWIPINNWWAMLLEFIRPSHLHSFNFFIKSWWKSMDNVLAASWANAFTFLYKSPHSNVWDMLRILLAPIPSIFIIKSSVKINE